MGIDLQLEHIVAFSRVPQLACIPRRRQDRRLHVSTIYRWHLRGIKGVRLEAIRVGGTFCTSIEALQRFFERLAEPKNQQPTSPTPSNASQMAVEKKLDSLGVLPPAIRPSGAEGSR